MNVVAFDTHAVVKTLTAVGFTDEQAEAVTHVIRDAHNVDLSSLATKADLAPVATKLDLADVKTGMAGIKAEIEPTRAEIAESKAEILKWMIGSMGLHTIVIIGAVLAMSRMLPR